MGMNRIKYDKKDEKLYLILGVVVTLIFVGSFVMLQFDIAEDSMSATFYAAFMIVSALFLPVISLVMWVMFFDSYTYLKRLERYGYIVPDNKKDYDNDIEKLIQGELKSFAEPSRESAVLAIVSWAVSLGMVGFVVFFLIRFSHMLENVSFLGYVSIFIAILWTVFGVYLWRQRSREKYRDDVEYNSTLKKRNHLVEGLVTILILLAITVFASTNIYTMAKYIEKSKEMNETAQVLSEEYEEKC